MNKYKTKWFKRIFIYINIIITILLLRGNVMAETDKWNTKNIMEYGAKGNGKADDTIAFKKAASQQDHVDLILPKGIYVVKGDLEIPSRLTLIFMTEARIRVEGNLSIYGKIFTKGGGPHFEITDRYNLKIKHLEAGRYQVFTGKGKVKFLEDAIPKIYVDWWKSGTDHTAALQAAISAANESHTKLVRLPDICTITETIDVPNATIIEGAGWGTIVHFIPKNPKDQPAFHTKSPNPPHESSYVVFRDFQLICHGGAFGFKIGEDKGEGRAWYGDGCQIKNVLIQDYTKAAIWLRRTIRFHAENVKTFNNNGKWGDEIIGLLVDQETDNIDGNNLATFVNCHFGSSRGYAVYLHNSGRGFNFIGCDFENTGLEGVYIRKDSKITNSYLGNINFIGCWFEGHNQAPGRINGDYASLRIDWVGGLQDFWPIQVMGCTFQGGGTGNKEIIVNNGEIIIVGGSIGRVVGKAINPEAIQGMGNARIMIK